MTNVRRRIAAAIALCSGLAIGTAAPAQPTRFIVKLRAEGAKSALTHEARIEKLGAAIGTGLYRVRDMALGAEVIGADRVESDAAAEVIAAKLAKNPDVEFAQVDHRLHALLAYPVNDEFITAQTYLYDNPTSINAFDAWTVTHGASSTVVAVVDTGYRPHEGMLGRFLPGYNMISDPAVSNDGGGRDSDATDPGDWLTASDATGQFAKCAVRSSSWHGTSVAGVIAANTNDLIWTAGIDWNAMILPVRVLGRCGGYDSDIVDGVAWAAGLDVPGVPPNPTPAQVINLSLGGTEPCSPVYPEVFGAAYANGVTRAIVVAAGNETADVSTSSPANCPGVIAVASTTISGDLATYSNFGTGIILSAPGGSYFGIMHPGIIVLSNSGLTTPVADSFAFEGGTSFAAPMVSGTISLMLAVAPDLTPDQIVSILTTTASPFVATSNCTTALCGAGIVNAGAAVRAAAAMTPVAPNYEGLWWAAPAGSESGWGINFAHQGNIIFATWFTYDTTGKAWWLSMTAFKSAEGVYGGTMYESHGPAFSAMPFNPALVTRSAVGSATLTFTDANDAQFAYTVNGVSQVKPITREVFGPLPLCSFGGLSNPALAINYQDLWWAAPPGSESGWGINLTDEGGVIFGTWFTYDLDGSPLWLSVTATSSGVQSFSGTLYRTSGPAFSATPFDPNQVLRTAVGSASFTFTDGANGTFAYTANPDAMTAISQTKAFTREVFVPPGTVCQ